jgi:MFS family permease
LQALALVPLGAASVTFASGVNSSLQLASALAMRGRAMALFAIVFLGSTAIGAPLIGWLAQVAGPRSGLLAGAAAALLAAAWARAELAAPDVPPRDPGRRRVGPRRSTARSGKCVRDRTHA